MVFDADSEANKSAVTGILFGVFSLLMKARVLYRSDQCLVSQSIISLSAL